VKLYCGIDPGLHGAIAWLGREDEPLLLRDTPILKKGGIKGRDTYDPAEMLSCLHVPNVLTFQRVTVAIEVASVRPNQSAQASQTTGYGEGLWHMGIAARGHRMVRVQPAAWKKAVGLPLKADKAASITLAKQLFPEAELHGPMGGGLDGRAEALLIAEYARRAML